MPYPLTSKLECWRYIPCVKTYFKYFYSFPVFSLSEKMNIQIPYISRAVATLLFPVNVWAVKSESQPFQ